MQPRHRGRHHSVAQRRLADQHIIGRAATIAAIDTEAGGRIALRIEIDDQHILTDGSQRCAEIDGCGGLADAALLIRQRQDARMVGRRVDLILLISLINYGHARVPSAVADGLCRSMRSSSTIQPCPPVRLECSCGLIFQYLVASVNSASTSWPLGNRAFAPWRTNGSAKPTSWCNGATARAVTQSTLPAILSTLSLISAKCTIPGDAVTRSASRRMFPPARRPAPRREILRRCRDRPRFWPTEQASEAAANRRYAGSTDAEASTAPRGWSSPATPIAGQHTAPAATLFHVKRE